MNYHAFFCSLAIGVFMAVLMSVPPFERLRHKSAEPPPANAYRQRQYAHQRAAAVKCIQVVANSYVRDCMPHL